MLRELLNNYIPFDAHETAMKRRLQQFLEDAARSETDAFGRELAGEFPRAGHITGSSWIVDERFEHTVLVHHAKLDKWVQPGGHCDGEADVLAVARREAEEETSLQVETESVQIFDIDVHQIPEYWRTPAHNHYDVRFLLRASRNQTPRASDESHDVRWFSLDDATAQSGEESIRRMVEKTRRLQSR